MTTQQAAEKLGLSPRTVSRYCQDGRLKATRHGRPWWITAAAVAKFKERLRPVGNPNFGKGVTS